LTLETCRARREEAVLTWGWHLLDSPVLNSVAASVEIAKRLSPVDTAAACAAQDSPIGS